MTPDTVMELAQQTLMAIGTICVPVLVTGLVAGLIVSIFQAATQVSESTLSFLPKIAAVGGILMLAGNWLIEQLTTFTTQIISRIAEVGP